jgi:arsenite-transporting ATPase
MSRPFERFDPLRLVLFSGKGGVGKTTLACGFARHWATRFAGERVLLLSTDPAHSLGDVLGYAVDDEARPLADRGNLQVRALDARRVLEGFKARHGEVLELLVSRGSFVEATDLAPVWDLAWPGLDELMAVLEIQRLVAGGTVDRVVVDMAPSGHTLSLLGLRRFLDNFLGALELFQQKHRTLVRAFGRSERADGADAFLVAMRAELEGAWAMLQDGSHAACLAVAVAEPMSYLETVRFLDALAGLGIPRGGVVLNRVLVGGDDADRLAEQEELFAKFARLEQPLVLIPEQRSEPLGGIALDALLAAALDEGYSALQPAPAPALLWPARLEPPLADFLAEGRRLVLIGGKGGVGKTTVAAAIACELARRHPRRRVRVVSIDPAHSLGDAFGCSLGHRPSAIGPNLEAQEVDARTILVDFRRDYLHELAEMMAGGTDDEALQVAYGPEAWRRIVSEALPGIDEMLALLAVVESLERSEADLVVLDTAPTGHLLRFLEMPAALGDWLAWIFRLWIKYQDVLGRAEFMGRLRALRTRALDAGKRLRDLNHSEFVAVTLAQEAVVAETMRLIEAVGERGVPGRFIVWNRWREGQTCTLTGRTLVRLPVLPRCVAPQERVAGAGRLLFAPSDR